MLQILLTPVEAACEQMAQIVRKDLSCGDLRFPAQGLHLSLIHI